MSRIVALFFAVSCLLASPAFADVISEDVASCDDKKKGDSCFAGNTKGTCEDAECCRLDYSRWNEEKDDRPPTTCKPCLRCKTPEEKAADKTADDDKKADDGKKADEAPKPATPPAKKSGCQAAGLGATGVVSLLSGVLLFLGLRRRT